jgi:phenylpyruvate tautomerase PptA (4-oxalocrotonate tautomerase family)
MPLVNVKVIKGVFDADQKREMIEKLTDRWWRSRVRTCAA